MLTRLHTALLSGLLIPATGPVARLSGQALVTGFVRADSTERPVWNAEVVADSGIIRARSGADGRFVLHGLGAGRHRILARAIGFKPLTVEIDLAARDTLELEVQLTRFVQHIAPLVVEGKTDRFTSGKMAEFDRRRSMGFGKFLDRAGLAKWDPLPVGAALRKFAGVRLQPRTWGCGGGFAVSTGRGGQQVTPCVMGPGCFLTIFVDGVRVWTPGDPGPPDIDAFTAAGLEGVEVYRGSAELPSEFGGTGSICGAIAFWTRTGEDPDH